MNMMIFISILMAVLIIISIGISLHLFVKNKIYIVEMDELNQKYNNQLLEITELNDSVESYKKMFDAQKEVKQRLEIQYAELKTHLEFKETHNIGYQNEINLLKNNIIVYQNTQNDLKNQLSSMAEREKNLRDKEHTFKAEFEAMARTILEDNSRKLSETSSLKLDDVLKPFKEQLDSFNKKVDSVYVEEAKERHSLKTEIEKLALTHANLHSQAENLTKALKGDNKTQGNWGEIQLERILEDSGLIKQQDYVLQGKGYGLIDNDGTRQLPDVIINLPEKRHAIIDAKVNLVSYERYINSDDQAERNVFLKQFLTSVKEQIKNLSAKGYQTNQALASPDFVLMFMPIESAYNVAIMEDAKLHSFAWERKIILVSPSVLFAMLKTIAYGISSDKQNKNTEEIVKQSGNMYDKFVAFLIDFQKIGQFIDRSHESYSEALKKLNTGHGNLIKRAEDIKKLGLTPKKNIPEDLLPNDVGISELETIETIKTIKT